MDIGPCLCHRGDQKPWRWKGIYTSMPVDLPGRICMEVIMNAEEQIVFDLLREKWQLESTIAGGGTLRSIARGATRFEDVSTGSKLDFASVLGTLVEAAVLIKTVLEIVKIVREAQKREPSVEDIESELAVRRVTLRNATHDFIRALIKDIIDRLPTSKRQ